MCKCHPKTQDSQHMSDTPSAARKLTLLRILLRIVVSFAKTADSAAYYCPTCDLGGLSTSEGTAPLSSQSSS